LLISKRKITKKIAIFLKKSSKNQEVKSYTNTQLLVRGLHEKLIEVSSMRG
jgi:hypothetical protein